MYEGQKFTIGGTEYVVPALSLKALKDFSKDGTLKILSGMTATPSEEEVDAAIRVIHAAFSRNYPLTIEAIADMVDMANLKPLTSSIFGASGLVKVQPGETPSP